MLKKRARFLLSQQGVEPDPEKVCAILEWPELQSFLSLEASWFSHLLALIYSSF